MGTSKPTIDPLGVRQFDYDDKSTWINNGGGYWHPNDAEPLPEQMADSFPQFEVGDLLMSYRSLNLISLSLLAVLRSVVAHGSMASSARSRLAV